MIRSRRLPRPRALLGGLLLASLLLAGCASVRLGYKLAPDLARGWLDGYLGFNEDQSEHVGERLEAFFRWHRAEQLPQHAQFLARLQAEAKEPGTTPAKVCRWYDEALAQLQPSIEHALPMAAQTVQQLTLKQVQNLERKYGKVNDEFGDTYLQPDPKDRLKAAVKRAVDRAESFYGRLDDAQKERLARGVAASPFDPEAWLAERRRRQQDTVQTLRHLVNTHAAEPAVQAALRRLVGHVQHSPDDTYRAYQERLRLYHCGLAAQLHNSASAEQRLAAAGKFQGWGNDFKALSSR